MYKININVNKSALNTTETLETPQNPCTNIPRGDWHKYADTLIKSTIHKDCQPIVQ